MTPLSYTRTIVLPDGGSAFENAEITLTGIGSQRAISEISPATSISFRFTPGDYSWQPHTAPRRRWIVMLDGTLEVIVSSGEARRFTVGDVLEVGDTHGLGHISQAVGGRPFRSAFIDLDTELVRPEPTPTGASAGEPPNCVDAVRTCARNDGQSENLAVSLPYTRHTRSGSVTDDIPITGFEIAWASGDLDSGWHTTGRRQIVVPLSGGMDVEANVGPRTVIPPGGIYFSEDMSGNGHRTRAVNHQPRLAIFAHLA
jgi:hypothetical protein